ncbi:MAG: type I restriction-modification system subunit M [Candidatus Omnitrophota bacterium]
MLTGELRAKIDRIWDDCWSGGISNPLSVIEQITYLLFIKRLDEIHTNREERANIEKKPFDNPVFPHEHQNLRWSKFKDMEAGKMYENMVADVFPFIKNLKSEINGSYSQYMKDAVFIIPTPQLLERVVTKLSEIPMERRDTKGDFYEYLLSRLSTAGQNGQFRTPRHIISMMVKLVKPMPRDIICDPASGTSGFLVGAAEYLQENEKDLFLNDRLLDHFNHRMFYGNDFDLTMQRIGAMNLLLHGVENPNLTGLDALSERNSGNREKYTLVLANPPFKGSLDSSSVSKDLLQSVKTKKTELLFLLLFIKMLKPGGRCACIVPDGVLFGSSTAHKDIRKAIIDGQKLEAVISMPSGVFKPYAGVSTAVMVFTRTDSGGTDRVWFYDMQADGFSLDDKRTELDRSRHENDNIPDIVDRWNALEAEARRDRTEQSFFVPASEIRENGYDLSINRYKELVHEEVDHVHPKAIISELKEIEAEIQEELLGLEGMLA